MNYVLIQSILLEISAGEILASSKSPGPRNFPRRNFPPRKFPRTPPKIPDFGPPRDPPQKPPFSGSRGPPGPPGGPPGVPQPGAPKRAFLGGAPGAGSQKLGFWGVPKRGFWGGPGGSRGPGLQPLPGFSGFFGVLGAF